MDRVIPPSEQRAAKRKRTIRLVLLAAFILVCGYFLLQWLRPGAKATDFRIARVERGTVNSSITATGMVVPAFEEQLNAPVATEIQKVHLRSGAEVKQGDLIMELDREYVSLQLEGRRDQLTLNQNKVELQKLEYDRDLADLEIDARVAKLELSSAESQLKDAERLLAIGGATREEFERAQLNVEMAKLARDKLDNALRYRRASDAGLRKQLQLEVAMEEKEVAQLSRRLRETEVKASRAGVITWINESIGQLVPEGEPLVRIADLNAFRIEAQVSDRYSGDIQVGMPVEVRHAQGQRPGTITSILPAVSNNTLRFLIALDDDSVEGLRPNMRVDIRIITGQAEEVLRLRNGPAIKGGSNQQLFVIRGEEAVRVPVTIGTRGGDFVEVTSGLQENDQVIISETERFDQRNSFKLENAR